MTLAAASPEAARTVILANSRQPDSVALGRFYARQRGIPPENLVALPMPEAEGVTWREFVDQVWQPLQDELFRRRWIEGHVSGQRDALGRRRVSVTGHRLAYLVVCRGTPLRIFHDPAVAESAALPAQLRTNQAAVDSELSLLAWGGHRVAGYLINPLFQAAHPAEVSAGLVVKVSRLDGPTAADARRLVTSALAAERAGLTGRYFVDLGGPHPDGDRWFEAARRELEAMGYAGETHAAPGTFGPDHRLEEAAFYLGWYAEAVNGPFLRPEFSFRPGAIALHLHSFSATTLRDAAAGWCGPLVARGAAATFGNVFEPYLQYTLRPDLLLQRLRRGATLGEAACFATPVLGWQGIVLGDPLYRPFPAPPAAGR